MRKLKPITRFKGEWRGIEYPNGKVRILDLQKNLIDSYTDPSGETINTNPVILDYAAEADIYLKHTEGIIELYDFSDVLIYAKNLNEFDD